MNKYGHDNDHNENTLRRSLQKPLVLVGMMGSGKSHIGRLLAARLGLDFYDTDSLVEERAGRSMSEIFETFGEMKFREAEKNAVWDSLERGPCVIATGGGAVTNPDSLAAIKGRGVSIWLKAPVSELLERIGQCGNRPLLQQDDPGAVLERLLEARRPLYEQADIMLETGGESADHVAENAIKSLCAYLDPRTK